MTKLDEQVAQIERRMREWKKEDKAVKAISEIPGVGLLTATAAVATMGDPKAFSSGREFAAWAGLVPKQTGSGGKVILQGISKRGDTYLRTLLIHGARAVISAAQRKKDKVEGWMSRLLERRNKNVAAVALANKNARIVWALLARDREFRSDYTSAVAAA